MKKVTYLGKKRSGVFLSALLALCILFVGCKKEDPTEPIQPPPVDTTYTLNFKDGTIPIVKDTIYKKYGESVVFSWDFVGTQKFEITKNSQHLSYEKKGTDKFIAENQVVYNCFVNDVKTKSYVIILVSEIPFPVINITADTSVAYNGTSNVSWNIQYSTAQYLNSAQIPITGNLQLTSLKRDTVLHFSASNSNGVKYTNKDITIYVGPPPPPTPLENLQAGNWYMKVWKINGVIVNIQDCQKDDYQIYPINMIWEEHRNILKCDPGENELAGRLEYSLYFLRDTLRLEIGVGNGVIYDVSSLNSNELNTNYKNSNGDFYEYEYTHQYP